MEWMWGLYALVGVIAGILGGLLGIGGGVITVPCLFYLFHFQGLSAAYTMHMAVATSLSAMILNALAASWAHEKKRNIIWPLFRRLVPGIILGAFLGVMTATLLNA